MTTSRFTRRLDSLRRTDVAVAGGKAANLGEMMAAGLPVPPGFVVTVDAFRATLEDGGVLVRVRPSLAALDVNDPVALAAVVKTVQDAVRAAVIAPEVREAIASAYRALGGDAAESDKARCPRVAVRSSATAEDAASASFAGMFESYLDVTGVDQLVERVRDCWASAFGARVLFYRVRQSLPPEMAVAVVVQRMVPSLKSGIMFTADPATRDRGAMVIEAAEGLGESIVQGRVTPERFVLDKATLARRIAPAAGARRILTDAEVEALALLALRAEAHFGVPQDLEFAIDADGLHLTQTRPITTLGTARTASNAPAEAGAVLLHGIGASPGTASGPVRVLARPDDGLDQGAVLVAHFTSPDWVTLMRRAAAIVTEAGGMTSHAAIVSRELGVPCVVGTGNATTALGDGMVVTVDGAAGEVRAGAAPSPAARPSPVAAEVTPSPATPAAPITATKLYVNLNDPAQAAAVAARDVDGVGLLRAELMLLDALGGEHPKQLLASGKRAEFVRRMADPLTRIARAFHPRPVVYRAMDFRSNEFRSLRGGETHEPVEANPMIGFRGCYRYTVDRELFAAELEALHVARTASDNLHLMIPFVRTASELEACLEQVRRSPLQEWRGMQRWVMAEVPSVIWRLADYAAMGIDAVSIGSNDLTQLVLGVDRDNERLAPLYDERDPAVLAAIREIVTRAHAAGLTVSICGQAPSVHPEYAEFLVACGIDSISVVPDAIERTRRNVARAEQALLLRAARQCGAPTAGADDALPER